MANTPGPAIEHLLGDAEQALFYAQGSKQDAKAIIEALVARGDITDASSALNALEIACKHDSWPSPATLGSLLELASSGQELTGSNGRRALEGALVAIASANPDESAFRRWCRPLASEFALRAFVRDRLHPRYAALFALEHMLGNRFPCIEAIRMLGRSGCDDVIAELAGDPNANWSSVGAVIALALDAASGLRPELGKACERAGPLAVAAGVTLLKDLLAEELCNFQTIPDSRKERVASLTRRLLEVAPESIRGWMSGCGDPELAAGIVLGVKHLPGVVLGWLSTITELDWFTELVSVGLGGFPEGQRVGSSPESVGNGSWSLRDVATFEWERNLAPLLEPSSNVVAMVSQFEASEAGRVLRAIKTRLPERDSGLPLAEALVDKLFSPDDVGRFFVFCAASYRALRPGLMARVPGDYLRVVMSSFSERNLLANEDWMNSVPEPEVAWRVLAEHGATPVIRGRGRAWLSERDLPLPEPTEHADIAFGFSHMSYSGRVTGAWVQEARRLLTEDFVRDPMPVEEWGSLARVVLDSGDDILVERLRRVWRVLLVEEREGAEALNWHFLEGLDPENDRELILSAFARMDLRRGEDARAFVKRLPRAFMSVAARSGKVPAMLRCAALELFASQPDFDEKKIDLSNAPQVLVELLDPWRLSTPQRLRETAYERALHLIVDQPLYRKAEDEASAALLALREAVRRYPVDPNRRRDIVRKRIRHHLKAVKYVKGKLKPKFTVVESWLEGVAWVRDWPDGRLRKDVEELAEKLDPTDRAALSQALQRARLELPKQPLEPESELQLVFGSLMHPGKRGVA